MGSTDGMALEERIEQTLMVGFPGMTASREVIELIQRYHVGNIILFSRNVHDAEQVRAFDRRALVWRRPAIGGAAGFRDGEGISGRGCYLWPQTFSRSWRYRRRFAPGIAHDSAFARTAGGGRAGTISQWH